jgi:hypothetical protein
MNSHVVFVVPVFVNFTALAPFAGEPKTNNYSVTLLLHFFFNVANKSNLL